MKFNSIALAGLVAALFPTAASAAKSDSQIWTNGAVNVKLSDKWRLQEEMTVRFSDNRNGLYELESNTLLGYRLNKVVTLWAGYTHNPQYAGGDFTVMEHRAREQVTFDGLRPYLKYSVPIAGKTALNLSTEPFFNLNTTPFQKRSGLDRVRNLVTVSTPLTKTLSGELGYMNQHGFVRGGPDTSDNIAYFGLSLSL